MQPLSMDSRFFIIYILRDAVSYNRATVISASALHYELFRKPSTPVEAFPIALGPRLYISVYHHDQGENELFHALCRAVLLAIFLGCLLTCLPALVSARFLALVLAYSFLLKDSRAFFGR